MATFRVLLDISETELNIGSKTVWICFPSKEIKLISELKKFIINRFNFSKKNFNLFLNGGMLLENEHVLIIEKGDILKLQYGENKLLDNQIINCESSNSSDDSLKDPLCDKDSNLPKVSAQAMKRRSKSSKRATKKFKDESFQSSDPSKNSVTKPKDLEDSDLLVSSEVTLTSASLQIVPLDTVVDNNNRLPKFPSEALEKCLKSSQSSVSSENSVTKSMDVKDIVMTSDSEKIPSTSTVSSTSALNEPLDVLEMEITKMSDDLMLNEPNLSEKTDDSSQSMSIEVLSEFSSDSGATDIEQDVFDMKFDKLTDDLMLNEQKLSEKETEYFLLRTSSDDSSESSSDSDSEDSEEQKEGKLQALHEQKFSKVYKNLIELNDLALVPNKEIFECPICFTNIVPGSGVVLKDCLHSFCKKCLRGSIRHSDTVEVQCPFVNDEYACDSHLQQREIRSLVTPEAYDNHLQRSVTFAESQASNSFHCQTPNCPGWCLVEGATNTFMCNVCGKSNCLACAAIHTGRNCKEYQDYLSSCDADEESKITMNKLRDMVKQGEAMHCPKCQVVITKRGGCRSMTCTMCGEMFYWTGKEEQSGNANSFDFYPIIGNYTRAPATTFIPDGNMITTRIVQLEPVNTAFNPAGGYTHTDNFVQPNTAFNPAGGYTHTDNFVQPNTTYNPAGNMAITLTDNFHQPITTFSPAGGTIVAHTDNFNNQPNTSFNPAGGMNSTRTFNFHQPTTQFSSVNMHDHQQNTLQHLQRQNGLLLRQHNLQQQYMQQLRRHQQERQSLQQLHYQQIQQRTQQQYQVDLPSTSSYNDIYLPDEV